MSTSMAEARFQELLRMLLGLEGSRACYSRTCVTVDLSAFKSLVNRTLGRPAAVTKMPAADVASFIHDSVTETPAQVVGFWNRDLGDFLFRPAPDHRVYIVDPETEIPLRSGRGVERADFE